MTVVVVTRSCFGNTSSDMSKSAKPDTFSLFVLLQPIYLFPFFNPSTSYPTHNQPPTLTYQSLAPPNSPVYAIHSISTGTPLGSCLTATQLLAGLCAKYFSNTPFISAKCAMSSRKTLTLTTRSILTPASVKMPTMFSQHCFVLSAMLPSIRLPFVSAGIWPETKICGPAMMAWDCGSSGLA
jgi:hypothetical protein